LFDPRRNYSDVGYELIQQTGWQIVAPSTGAEDASEG